MDDSNLKKLALRVVGGHSSSYDSFLKSFTELNDYVIKCGKPKRAYILKLFTEIAKINPKTVHDCNKYISFIETLNNRSSKIIKFPEISYRKSKKSDIVRLERLESITEHMAKEEDEEYDGTARDPSASISVSSELRILSFSLV